MTEELELVRRLREDAAPPSEAAWTAVRAAVANAVAAEQGDSTSRRMRAPWRSPRLLAFGVAAVGLTGAAAYGATQVVGVGSPAPAVGPPPIVLPAKGFRLLGLRIPDLAGGPPWGIRLAVSQAPLLAQRAGKGAVLSVEIGRVVDGEIGFVGQDNAFHNDRLFHAASPLAGLMTPADYALAGTAAKPVLPSTHRFDRVLPAVASAYPGCSTIYVPLRGTARVATETQERSLERQLAILRADGPLAKQRARRLGTSVATLTANAAYQLRTTKEQLVRGVSERTFATCPRSDLRTLIAGFTGPGSTAITIAGNGIRETEHVNSTDDGFYLFVLDEPWARTRTFTATITCTNGRTDHGPATPSAAGPNAPHCPAS